MKFIKLCVVIGLVASGVVSAREDSDRLRELFELRNRLVVLKKAYEEQLQYHEIIIQKLKEKQESAEQEEEEEQNEES